MKSRDKDVFLQLVKEFPLRPIRTEVDHEAAGQMIRRLVWNKPAEKRSSGERDYLEALTILVHDYLQKQQASALEELTPIEILRHLMAEHDMTVTALGEVIGNRSAASMIMNGRRQPSKTHILLLAERFGVDPALFLSK